MMKKPNCARVVMIVTGTLGAIALSGCRVQEAGASHLSKQASTEAGRSLPDARPVVGPGDVRPDSAPEGFESLGKNEHGRHEYRHGETGIVFVALPGGTFEMGSSEAEAGREPNEGPAHKVQLSPFMIAKYEVSQAEWKKVMGNNPSEFKGDALPVERVSWNDCQEYCKKTGLTLPTEAQWEYVCRAGTRTPFAFGTTISTNRVNFDGDYPYAETPKGEYREATVAVDSFEPNAWGIHNMHGNVSEWCVDSRREDFYQESAGARDPLCENSGGPDFRMFRGGSWDSVAGVCRSASRSWDHASIRDRSRGFRPVWSSP